MTIFPRDVRVTEITQDATSIFNSTTTFNVYAIVRYLGTDYVVNNDIVAQSITVSSLAYDVQELTIVCFPGFQ